MAGHISGRHRAVGHLPCLLLSFETINLLFECMASSAITSQLNATSAPSKHVQSTTASCSSYALNLPGVNVPLHIINQQLIERFSAHDELGMCGASFVSPE